MKLELYFLYYLCFANGRDDRTTLTGMTDLFVIIHIFPYRPNIFNVKVAAVKTMQIKGKVKQRGRIVGKRKDWKKAIVTLRQGDTIEFFEHA